MKRMWEEPRIEVQQFIPNEYVAACVVGSIQCAYPGDGKTNGQMKYDDYNNQSSGWYEDNRGMLHGICGNETPISFNGNTGTGFESDKNGVIQRDRPIYNINGYNLIPGVYTVTWNSNSGGDDYYHTGRLTIDYIDNDRPNHS